MTAAPGSSGPALAAALALFGVALPAVAAVDVPVGNGNRVLGTLRPADEVETFRVRLPAGALLKLKAKGRALAKGGTPPALALRVLDATDTYIGAGTLRRTGRSGYSGTVRATETGEYKVQVVGDGVNVGDYQLTVKWKSPTRRTFQHTDGGPGDGSTFDFPVEAGSAVSVSVTPTKGSAADPAVDRFDGPGLFTRTVDPPARKVKNVVVPEFGTTRLSTHGGGEYAGVVTVKQPKAEKRLLRFDERTLGRDTANGGDLAFGQIVGSGGGVVGIGDDLSDLLGGSSVNVPAGALGGPTSLYLGTAAPFPAPGGGAAPAGPTVFFGPEGLQFSVPATVTIPFDAAKFAGSADELRVFTRDADGNVSEITEFTLDLDAGTCSFQTSHFSSFRVFVPRGPRPVRGDFDHDGFGDFVLRHPGAAGGLGRVEIYRGGVAADAFPVLRLFDAQPPYGAYGESIEAGDLNDDGFEDLIVGAPELSGAVFVFFGPFAQTETRTFTGDIVISPQTGDFGLGVRLAVADVNGDSVDDLIVGAEGSSTGQRGAGAAYVFFGSTDLTSRSTAFADVLLSGRASGDGFGASVTAADFDGDGVADVAVGSDEFGRGGNGAVDVFQGGPGFSSTNTRHSIASLGGANVNDVFGLEIAAGEVTGDGRADLVVAAAGSDAAATDAGAVSVHSGAALNGTAITLTGESTNDDFGFNVQVGDVDGDGTPDVVASADAARGRRGAVYVFKGGSGLASKGAAAADVILVGRAANDSLGVLQPLWDVTGDGVADLVLYAPDANNASGVVYIVPGGAGLASGDASQIAVFIAGGEPGTHLGRR